MSDIPLTPDSEADLLAAEFVIGLLDLAERTAAATRIARDTVFAASVEAWEQRLSGLNDDYAEAPAPNLLPQIEARLFPTSPTRGFLGNLWAWGTAVAVALALVAYLALTPPAPDFTATLIADATDLRYDAVIAGDQLTITHVAGAVPPAGQSYELWIIAGNDPPRSLGVLPAAVETLSLPGVAAGQTLAISLEPLGGSPTGAPTTVLIAGTLSAT